jgi:hypothetical protein
MNTDKHGFNRRKQRERRGGKRQNHKEDWKFEIRNFKAEDLRSLTKLLCIVARTNTNNFRLLSLESYSRNATLDITPPAIALERRKTKEPKSCSLPSVNQDGKSASVYLGEYDCCKSQDGGKG